MAKIVLDDVQNIYGNPTSAEGAINANSAKIETAFENTLSRDGTSPNYMNANLDMNSNKITNVQAGTADTDAVNVLQLRTVTSPSVALDDLTDVAVSAPITGDHLIYDGARWINQSVEGGGTSLVSLIDTSISNPQNQHALVYNSSSGLWENQTLPSGVTDHGALTGLADDDHQQYFNTVRGDARYLRSGRLINTAGSLTGGGALTTDLTLQLVGDQTFPPATHYYGTNAAGVKGYHAIPQPTNDHGVLGGLADDDHPQYLTQTRGDARYSLNTHVHTNYADKTIGQTITSTWYFDYVPYISSMGAMLYHGDPNKASGKVTISSNPPSGGADGDIWFVVA